MSILFNKLILLIIFEEIIEYITDKTTQGKTNIPASLLKVTIASIIYIKASKK